MLTYRGRQIDAEITGAYMAGGRPVRMKRYSTQIDGDTVWAMSIEELCKRIDAMVPTAPEPPDPSEPDPTQS